MLKQAIIVSMLFVLALTASADLDADAQAVLEVPIDDGALVGVSAAISKNGTIVWEGGAGFRDRHRQLPADANMVHRIASITKSITAVAVMQLVEREQIDLDASLQTYLPDYPANEKGVIRVRHLLTHTSGVRHYRVGENRPTEHYATLDDALRLFWDRSLAFPPGERFVYTTYGYTVLGAVIERVSGQSYAEYMREHIWIPTGMTNTSLEVHGQLGPNRSELYRRDRDGEIENDEWTDLSVKYPGGGLISTAGDLVRFAVAFDSGGLISPETKARMMEIPDVEKRRLPYASGWMVWDDNRYGHYYQNDGGQAGTSTYLAVLPEHGIAVAVLGNVARAGGEVRRAAFSLVDLILESR